MDTETQDAGESPLAFLDQPRDESGRFAPKAPEPTPEAAPDAPAAAAETPAEAPEAQPAPEAPPASAPAPTPTPEPVVVPVTAIMDERDRRQKAERELAELRAQMERQQPPPQAPDRNEDPEAYEAWREQSLQAALYNQNLRVSRRFAERQYGAETVQQVHEWAFAECAKDPVFNNQVMTSDDPYEFAMQAFNRDRVLTTVKPDDLAAFLAWKDAQAASQAPPSSGAAPAAPASNPSPPPRSLATVPSAGGAHHVPIGPGQAYDSIFKG